MIEHFLNKLLEVLSTAWGWLMFVGLVVMNFIVGYEKMVGFTVMAIVLDAVWGIAASLLQKRFALSELARDTFAKLAVYGTAVFVFILVDKLAGISGGLTTSVICIGIILVELWSMSASMLICFPNMPFLKILKKALAGEIASKLNVKPEDVMAALDTLHTKKNERH
jgi:hypothetical protein|nr:MAG TPA: holin [Bacteriophage sp.]